LVSIILSLVHFVVVGVVSSLSSISIIPSPKYVGDHESSSVMLAILFIGIN
jgi:hypothetical protein